MAREHVRSARYAAAVGVTAGGDRGGTNVREGDQEGSPARSLSQGRERYDLWATSYGRTRVLLLTLCHCLPPGCSPRPSPPAAGDSPRTLASSSSLSTSHRVPPAARGIYTTPPSLSSRPEPRLAVVICRPLLAPTSILRSSCRQPGRCPSAGATAGSVARPVLHVALPLTRPHAQASATFPENTLASFEKAIRDGAEGIESGISP